MKKTYITPSIRIVRIEASAVLMAGSDGRMGYTSTEAQQGQEVLSKRKSLWDDDEW